MTKIAKEVTNRKEVRAAVAQGGWEVVWGDQLDEFDALLFNISSIPTGTVRGWISQKVQGQLTRFSQSPNDVSGDVIEQATQYLENLIEVKGSGEADMGGLGVKGGFATYNRHMDYLLFDRPVGSHSLPNNHQPYIALRVTKPLPAKAHPGLPVPRQRNLGNQILLQNDTMYEGEYLTSSNGQYQLILQADGNLVMYGPGHSVIWHTQTNGTGQPPFRLVAQADRNMVLYHTPSDAGNPALWTTHTGVGADRAGCFLILQDDRNLVLYEPNHDGGHEAIWQSHTFFS